MTRVAHFCKESDTFWSLSSELNIAPIRIFTINSRWAWVPLERVGSYLTVSTMSCTKLVSKSYDSEGLAEDTDPNCIILRELIIKILESLGHNCVVPNLHKLYANSETCQASLMKALGDVHDYLP